MFKKNVDQLSKQMENSVVKEETAHLDRHSASAGDLHSNKLIFSEIHQIRRDLEQQRYTSK
mgnify:CR=1 FL=1